MKKLNRVCLDNNTEVHYDHLVIAAGLTLNWNGIEGLAETLGKNGVTSNYRYDLAPYTWKLVQELKQGKAIFTQPPMPIKCAGAPQKALYLSADYWYKNGTIKNIDISFYNSIGALFGVKEYVPALLSYMEKYNAHRNFLHTLTKIDGETKTAWFTKKDTEGNDETISTQFDMIHVCPPQCAPTFIRESVFADANGWVDVDQYSLRHKTFENVWGLGDVTNTPNAKTMAAVRKQAPVVAQNIFDALNGKSPSTVNDGYGSCPLTVERGKIVLAEFSYGGKVTPSCHTWINDGPKATKFAWKLKANVLPLIYWHAMLKGHEWLASPDKVKS
ncbi:MAG: NAD(P)/FAD-dependent oxidoreductase [Bacteroidales bacterium]|nr:NAD(P)/FAD-dependent oxidoreductase [Bacteroidales bacterium]